MAQSQWSRGSGYTSDQMMQMQRDAERRVREMQRQADRNLGQSQRMNRPGGLSSSYHPNTSAQPRESSPTPSEPQQTQSPAQQPANRNYHSGGSGAPNPIAGLLGSLGGGSSGGQANTLSGILSNFGIGAGRPEGRETPLRKVMDALHLDNERLLLIFLIVLLLNDGGDTTLILALCYLVL